ncbi:hypothetical protein [Haloarcula nitratireducens]|uniref:Uncharacterized protein n=1 Tax=Haloarcula nitratireducens TaxID=2487749 RepID=A0AAW4PBR6_9EURY|nr:hypothetical protein [Halomicroarcula nitratireducens]MBX0295335.1 hypothetical protein [Halomicroarcula nitratireducens]
MSDDALASAVDTREILSSLDYEELFEGTKLEGIEQEDGDITEAVGRRLGELAGRKLGELLGGYLGAMLIGQLLEGSDDGEETAEDEETAGDEESAEESDDETDSDDGEE